MHTYSQYFWVQFAHTRPRCLECGPNTMAWHGMAWCGSDRNGMEWVMGNGEWGMGEISSFPPVSLLHYCGLNSIRYDITRVWRSGEYNFEAETLTSFSLRSFAFAFAFAFTFCSRIFRLIISIYSICIYVRSVYISVAAYMRSLPASSQQRARRLARRTVAWLLWYVKVATVVLLMTEYNHDRRGPTTTTTHSHT